MIEFHKFIFLIAPHFQKMPQYVNFHLKMGNYLQMLIIQLLHLPKFLKYHGIQKHLMYLLFLNKSKFYICKKNMKK